MPLKSILSAFDSVIRSSNFHLCIFTYIYYDVLLLIHSSGVFMHTSSFWTALINITGLCLLLQVIAHIKLLLGSQSTILGSQSTIQGQINYALHLLWSKKHYCLLMSSPGLSTPLQLNHETLLKTQLVEWKFFSLWAPGSLWNLITSDVQFLATCCYL